MDRSSDLVAEAHRRALQAVCSHSNVAYRGLGRQLRLPLALRRRCLAVDSPAALTRQISQAHVENFLAELSESLAQDGRAPVSAESPLSLGSGAWRRPATWTARWDFRADARLRSSSTLAIAMAMSRGIARRIATSTTRTAWAQSQA